METTTLTADDLVAVLVGRGEWWDIYRPAIGGWLVRLGHHNDPQTRSFNGATLVEVLSAAAASPPLPVVPREPQAMHAWQFDVVREGSTWGINFDGRSWLGNYKTKVKAEEQVAREVAANATARQAWAEQWGATVAAGAEGVDFRWAK